MELDASLTPLELSMLRSSERKTLKKKSIRKYNKVTMTSTFAVINALQLRQKSVLASVQHFNLS